MIKSAKDLQKDIYERLAPYAVKESRGRVHKESSDHSRLPFQLDRDRIIHCKAFRRLDEKTQVFTASYGDHYRTRLTHTMEVAQISRDIARTFGLNEDLCEAIALAHDLGHTPFGHAGEDTLDKIMRQFGLHFEHNEQSRWIVEKLEKLYPDFFGLNLTYEVLDGLVKHKTSWDRPEIDDSILPSLEAQVVNLADEIAYTNHDVDDGLRSGLFDISDLEKTHLWKIAEGRVSKKYRNISDDVKISRFVSMLINLMVSDLYECTEKNLSVGKHIVEFSHGMRDHIKEMRDFLMERFYYTKNVQVHLKEGRKIIEDLFEFYFSHPENLSGKLKYMDEKIEIAVKDYIAGMTDRFAKKEHERLVKKRK